jgi:site-specific DNA recombinase
MKDCSEQRRSNWRKTGLVLFRAAQEQLEENRTRARLGRRRLGHLLQGLTCCAICRYAYYGKTTRERGPGHTLKDYRYYRCSGTDGYRFGGERICTSRQIQAESLEAAVWREVCDLLRNPEKLEQDLKENNNALASLETAEVLKAQRLKQQHALERLIDSFAEGLISKDQFTSRMSRTRSRIAELDAEIQAYSGDIDQIEHRRLAAARLRELSATVGPDLSDADWHRKREITRTLVQRIEIGHEKIKIVFRLSPDAGRSGPECIAVTLPR